MFPNTSGLLLQAPSPLPAAGSGGEAESECLARSFGGVTRIIWDWGSPGKTPAVQNAPARQNPKTERCGMQHGQGMGTERSRVGRVTREQPRGEGDRD